MADDNETKNPFENIEEQEVVNTQNIDELNLDELQAHNNIENSEENVEEVNEEIENEPLEQLNKLQAEYDELNNKYIRLAADFDNFRKRTQTEKEELSNYTIATVLSKLTGVLDTFDRAYEHLKDIDDCKTVKEGYEVAYKQLTEALKKIGLEEIDALGKPFDPNEHEAVTQVPTDEFDPDCVAVVMQKGYKLDKRIVRPALVGVAVKK
jgi:molecular chaperone GrpE